MWSIRYRGGGESRPGCRVELLMLHDLRELFLSALVLLFSVGCEQEPPRVYQAPKEPPAIGASASTGSSMDMGGEIAAESGMTWTVELPDSVGKVLDEWLPGWDALSSRSCQILRLLKSGGPAPPEEFLLGGVLEEELERWLMPRLTKPAVVNIAHELNLAEAALPGGSKDRLVKAITQIERGKPRKEIVKPAYAGEILWAFRGNERRRQAIGSGPLNDEELRMLCEGLVSRPPAYLRCLELIAKTMRANTE